MILEIAKATLSFKSQPSLKLDPILFPFLSQKRAQLSVHSSFKAPPSLKEKRPFYERENTYRFYRISKGFLIQTNRAALESELRKFSNPAFLGNLPKAILLDRSLTKATFFWESGKRKVPFHVLWHHVYLLISHLLTVQRRGIFVHAGGISDHGRGFLFVGPSGAGKSTLARIFERQKGVSVLGDDFMVIRKQKEGPWIYGTPLTFLSSPPREGVPLEAIFFISHGRRNALKKITPRESLGRFLSQVPPILWVPEGLSFSAQFSLDLCTTLPTYALAFAPDEKVVSFLREIF